MLIVHVNEKRKWSRINAVTLQELYKKQIDSFSVWNNNNNKYINKCKHLIRMIRAPVRTSMLCAISDAWWKCI